MFERRALRPGAAYPPDAEPGPLQASAVGSLKGLLIGGSKGGHGPKGKESPIESLEPHPGQDPETESSSRKLSATSCQHHDGGGGAVPSAPSSSSSPAKGSPLGEEGGEAGPVLLLKGSGPHPALCRGAECGPTWKMIGTIFTEEHPRRIQHASSETSVENVKATPVCGTFSFLKIQKDILSFQAPQENVLKTVPTQYSVRATQIFFKKETLDLEWITHV